jgi:hypothetical protein
MKKLGMLIFMVLLVITGYPQDRSPAKFHFARKCTIVPVNIPRDGALFGGISSLEFVDRKALLSVFKPIPEAITHPDRTGGDRILLLTADRNKMYNALYPNCFAFSLGAGNQLQDAFNYPVKLSGIECIRYNKVYKKFFFSFENDVSTGVGYLQADGAEVIFSESIGVSYTSDNRGIEGITFTEDNRLWLAFESGKGIECKTENTAFLRMQLQPEHGLKPKVIDTFYYELNRCSCMNSDPDAPCKVFDGICGNGISEILAVNNSPDSLLVVERCWNKQHASVILYLATVTRGSKQLQKRAVYDFKNLGKEQLNIEGMAWGAPENGSQMLYLINDNNYEISKQENVLIVLRQDKKL